MKKDRKAYLYLWLLLAVALAAVCAIAFVDEVRLGGWEVRKGTFREVLLAEEKAGAYENEDADGEPEQLTVTAEADSTVRNVLIFGDSMTILVANRLAAYGEENGYKVTSVTWDGSSSVTWSSCDTLDNFIARVKPDFIVVTLGSNELFLKNFDSRRPYVEKVVAKMKGIPFVWISPPNWKEDVGFNKMMRQTLPAGTFYDSNKLTLARGKDNIHPTVRAGIEWTDSIMSWMPYTPHPIASRRPTGKATRIHDAHYFRAGGGRMAAPPVEAGLNDEEPEEASEHMPGVAPEPGAAPEQEPGRQTGTQSGSKPEAGPEPGQQAPAAEAE